MDGPKIFPRNLTARAARLIDGNPATSRPESMLDTSSPGYEIDIRNLDQRFFPGLLFDFYADQGAKLIAVDLQPDQRESGFKFAGDTYYLWAMYGRIEPDGPLHVFGFKNVDGMSIWRRVRDLAPGRVSILLGPGPGRDMPLREDQCRKLFENAFHGATARERNFVEPLGKKASVAILTAERAAFVDETSGVIDPVYAPGELTKSLCAPWVYDFHDCGCFYWSSNKPDVVANADTPYLNFQRASILEPDGGVQDRDIANYGERRKRELTYKDMAEGAWRRLPVILNDREDAPETPIHDFVFFTPDEFAAEIHYLAMVEHALLVEYLYAYFSVDAPAGDDGGRFAPPHQSFIRPDKMRREKPVSKEARVNAAIADDVLQIATDEMRHFFWANQVLKLLGKPPSTARATVIGADPNKFPKINPIHKLRKKLPPDAYLNQRFALAPLTAASLEQFRTAEQNSKAINGMYYHLLRSVEAKPEEFPNATGVASFLKLLVDEGGSHYERLSRIDAILAANPEAIRRREFHEPPTAQAKQLRETCRMYYDLILALVHIACSLPERANTLLLDTTKQAMHLLGMAVLRLASDGVDFKFDLPARRFARPGRGDDLVDHIETMRNRFRGHFRALRSNAWRDRHAAELHRMFGAALHIVQTAEERPAAARAAE